MAIRKVGRLSPEELQQLKGKSSGQSGSSSIADKIGNMGGNIGEKLPGFLGDLLAPRTKKFGQEYLAGQHRPEGALEKLLLPYYLAKKYKETGPVAAELGSYMIPGSKGVKAASKLPLIGGKTVPLAGMARGALLASTSPEEMTFKERAGKTLKGAGTGAAFDIALAGAGKLKEKIKKQAKPFVLQLFKPTSKHLKDLRKYGKMEFADEVIDKDIQNIKGMNDGKLRTYFNDQVDNWNNKADEFLGSFKVDPAVVKKGAEGTGVKTVPNEEVGKIIYDTMSGRKAPGRAMQGGAISKLKSLADDWLNFPGAPNKPASQWTTSERELFMKGPGIDLVQLNGFKRDVQTAAKSYYSASGKPTPQSKALADVAREVNNLIERYAPGVKDINRNIMYYNTARDALVANLDRLSKRESSVIIKGLYGTTLLGAVSGKPGLAALGAVPIAAEQVYRSPQFKSRAAATAQKVGETTVPEAFKRAAGVKVAREGGK